MTPHSKSYAVSTIIPLVLHLRVLKHRLADLFKVGKLECIDLGFELCSSKEVHFLSCLLCCLPHRDMWRVTQGTIPLSLVARGFREGII